ncbi:TPA: protein-export chaperone SecB [Vibrio parahaemolyticus]|uniref:protein-export chaperone SecB n=2 Tax=Vibrio TaxID=662 RepID=UPI00084B21FE|nr:MULTISPECIES: protein-export chaperone SecB [Vibrio harveyi group]EJG1716311.1 protein-export chaperone SecB [Vibrio parahaemolyticus]EKA7375022.1 protein-export chaperone SecB [Vibrio parahaemolyticus]ELA9377758.1 protein-export chaperone SecB [Vibrio parahaemolyticus]ELI6428388.1 protein-export chaperone SecB [Vibrio harveyi]ELK8488093.1 protein-export chaperone SecB [Vibrio parahaemolyticus]
MSDSKKADFNYHPIQLREIKVLKLSIEDNPDFEKDHAPEDFSDFGFYHQHSDYDSEAQVFWVKVKAVVGRPEDGCKTEHDPKEAPFNMEVELVGLFSVDENSFNIEHIDSFARRNAPLVMYPYLREHVYSLTSRAGYDSTLLPLFEVPAFKLQK